MRTTILLFLTILTFTFLGNSQKGSWDTRKIISGFVTANDSFTRSIIADSGAAIISVQEDRVFITALPEEVAWLEKRGFRVEEANFINPLDFPAADAEYHNYDEVTQVIRGWAARYPDWVQFTSIGRSVMGREIWAVRITGNVSKTPLGAKPAALYLGGHHAREHLSVETPLRFAKRFLEQAAQGDSRILRLLETREILLIPMVNPDGLEYDIEDGRYKSWRKNRATNQDGTRGVDLNRNYAYRWGTGGSSRNPNSDVYMGPQPFSEPETRAIKNFIERNNHITILISFHTFSELILYPWGHTNEPIAQVNDRLVHEKIAQKMATWNNYTPQQSSDLYIASGDMTDWSYGEMKIISFTFELDPKDQWRGGGFYPGAGVIEPVLNKNWEPCLYVLELAANPYQVLSENSWVASKER